MGIFVFVTAATAAVVLVLRLFLGHGSVWWFGVGSGGIDCLLFYFFDKRKGEMVFFL